MEYYEMINGGEHNVYHLLFLMIANFIISDWQNKCITYYYPRTSCKLAEGMLSLLPPNFIRQYEKDPGINYIPFMHKIPFFGDIAPLRSYMLIRKLYEKYMQPCGGTSIYIQRKTGIRKIINEEEVIPLIKRFGYQVYALEDYPVVDQIKIVSAARHILAPHGAGLAFTVFCNSEARIIEMNDESHPEQKHYMHLAYALGLRFYRYTVKKEGDDLYVDTKKLEFLLNVINL